MRYVKTVLKTFAFLVVFGFLHYVLPQHDVVRITGTEVIRMDFSASNRLFFAQADSGNLENTTRDVRLINTVRRKTFLLGFVRREAEGVMVYRNEDTGWIWPPYFKFDSSDLQAEAADLQSTAADPQWVVMTHYGWRNRFLTIYPNAISVRPVAGPDVRIIPWFNIFFLLFVGIAFLFVRAAWRQLRERSIDPAMSRAGEAWDTADSHIDHHRGRFSRWLGSWRRKPPPRR
jgi:hypothetical protein